MASLGLCFLSLVLLTLFISTLSNLRILLSLSPLLQFHEYNSTTMFVLVCWAGSNRFYENIEDMIGYKPLTLIKWCWMFLTPGICAVSIKNLITEFKNTLGFLQLFFRCLLLMDCVRGEAVLMNILHTF